ncbi:MAG TPA: type II toxin-antitoxin system RelE/ParE family toxin [Candidatus Saccharimonadales bacterium]
MRCCINALIVLQIHKRGKLVRLQSYQSRIYVTTLPFSYIHDDLANPKAAQNIVQKILQRMQQLDGFPGMGASMTALDGRLQGYKHLVVDNYLVIYRHDEDAAHIVHVLYARSDYMRLLQD